MIALLRARRGVLCTQCLATLLEVTTSAAHGTGLTIEQTPGGTRTRMGECASAGSTGSCSARAATDPVDYVVLRCTLAGVPLARDVIVAFMNARPGAAICRICLSTGTGVPLERVLDGWNDLVQLHRDYGTKRGHCADCGDLTDMLVKR